VAVVKTAAAFDTTRRYHITATDLSGTVSTTTPREIYVEHLISQNRNSITDVKFGPTIPTVVSVPAGGSMDMVVGNTYVIQLLGGTATQGYNQFEAFINFPNTIFQILSVSTTYSADDSPYTIASLASGTNVTINVTATINAAGAFDNSATVTATEPDPNPANNTDNTGNGGTTGTPSADLGISKTAPTPLLEESQFDYTLVVTNHGPSTATGVTVTDPLPANFTLATATPTQGSCSGTTTVTCNLGTIPNGATATITIHGTGHVAGTMTNTATVSGNETDSVPANNSSTAPVVLIEDVPAMSGYALMLLALTLAIAAAIAIRPRG
jgi:uncharacterized repeat protein (TIGR01451 family)